MVCSARTGDGRGVQDHRVGAVQDRRADREAIENERLTDREFGQTVERGSVRSALRDFAGAAEGTVVPLLFSPSVGSWEWGS